MLALHLPLLLWIQPAWNCPYGNTFPGLPIRNFVLKWINGNVHFVKIEQDSLRDDPQDSCRLTSTQGIGFLKFTSKSELGSGEMLLTFEMQNTKSILSMFCSWQLEGISLEPVWPQVINLVLLSTDHARNTPIHFLQYTSEPLFLMSRFVGNFYILCIRCYKLQIL